MSKKDYIAIAKLFAAQAATADTETHAVLRLLAAELAGILANDNPNFIRSRFLTACGLL
jgi:hypothetical protein